MPFRRSVFLINRKFQLRFAFYVCSWLFALSLVYPLIIYNLFVFFTRYMASDPHGPPPEALFQTRHEVLYLLVALQGAFLVVTFLISIFTSHRIAGPLYKLRRHFESLREGNFDQELRFRKKDHFQDLAEDYNAMLAGLRAGFTRRFGAVSDAVRKIERAKSSAKAEDQKVLEEVISSLREISPEKTLNQK